MGRSLTINAFGVCWRIDLSLVHREYPDLAGRIEALWARTSVADEGEFHQFRVVRPADPMPTDGNSIPRGVSLQSPAEFPYALSRAITFATLSVRYGQALMLHAAGLASPDGERAVVLVGPSGTGKSTAVQSLGHRFGYVTDETIAIESDLTISPYPKPISIRASDRAGDKDEYAPDELGLAPTPPCPRVAAVVVLSRAMDHQKPELTPIGLIDGILAVLPESSSIYRLDRPLCWLARALVSSGGPFMLTYAEIETCGDLLGALLAGEFDSHQPWWTPHSPGEAMPESGPAGTVARTQWIDAVESDDEVVVLIDRVPVRLSGVAATAWLCAERPVSNEELVIEAVRRHGDHPESAVLIRKAVEQLVDAGLLLRSGA